jgi:hypothetical protein
MYNDCRPISAPEGSVVGKAKEWRSQSQYSAAAYAKALGPTSNSHTKYARFRMKTPSSDDCLSKQGSNAGNPCCATILHDQKSKFRFSSGSLILASTIHDHISRSHVESLRFEKICWCLGVTGFLMEDEALYSKFQLFVGFRSLVPHRFLPLLHCPNEVYQDIEAHIHVPEV